jgi:mono/diheme cytochrome c family protein
MAAAGLVLLAIAVLGTWLVQQQRQAAAPVVINETAAPPLPPLDRQAAALGEPLYLQSCAACHGADLRGAPDWKTSLEDGSFPPPPHDDSGHTWHHPDFLLLQIMAEGGLSYGGVMPGFSAQLSETEMAAILEYLKSRWSRESREYQWWITNVYPTPTPMP